MPNTSTTRAYVDAAIALIDAGVSLLTARTITMGDGGTGGGDLTANRVLNVVGNADGSILANANDVQVGVLATDAQHGVRGGGTQHALAVSAGAAGFMTGADKAKADTLQVVSITEVADADYVALATDWTVVYTSLTVTRTVTLPPIAGLHNGFELTFKDGTGNASILVNIVVEGDGAEQVDGAASQNIITARGSLTVRKYSGGWILV